MPRETISTNSPRRNIEPANPSDDIHSFAIGWSKGDGWVQAYMIPDTWETTGDWGIVDLTEAEIDQAIRVLKRAKRQAWPTEVQHGAFIYEDGEPGVEPPSK